MGVGGGGEGGGGVVLVAVIGGAAAASAACTATPRAFLGWAEAREGEAAGTSRLGRLAARAGGLVLPMSVRCSEDFWAYGRHWATYRGRASGAAPLFAATPRSRPRCCSPSLSSFPQRSRRGEGEVA